MPKGETKTDDPRSLKRVVRAMACRCCGPSAPILPLVGLSRSASGGISTLDFTGTTQMVCMWCGASSPRCRDVKTATAWWNRSNGAGELPGAKTNDVNMQNDIKQSERPAGLAPTACSAAWQPIETAPKDGTSVLLVWRWDSGLHTGTTVIMASWVCRKHAMLSSPHRCPDEPDCKMGWDNYAGNFSHWMPLPEPPNAQAHPQPGAVVVERNQKKQNE